MLQREIHRYEENTELLDFLYQQHNLKLKNSIVRNFDTMGSILTENFKIRDLQKIGLYPVNFENSNFMYQKYTQGINTPCIILDTDAFVALIGKETLAATVHKCSLAKKNEIAKSLGIHPIFLYNTSFTIIKDNYHNIDLIHEATHIIQPKQEKPALKDEIDAFINEIVMFKHTENRNFEEYQKMKIDENGNINDILFQIIELIWQITYFDNFYAITPQIKGQWINEFLLNNPLKTPLS